MFNRELRVRIKDCSFIETKSAYVAQYVAYRYLPKLGILSEKPCGTENMLAFRLGGPYHKADWRCLATGEKLPENECWALMFEFDRQLFEKDNERQAKSWAWKAGRVFEELKEKQKELKEEQNK